MEWWKLSSQVSMRCDGALLSWGRLAICLPMEMVLEFLVWFTRETVFSSNHEFSHFNSSDSPPHPYTEGVSKWLCEAQLLSGVKP